MEPGLYQLRDDDPAYLDAMAEALVNPAVERVATRQLGLGVRLVTFRVGERGENPPPVEYTRKMPITSRYFGTALDTYSVWKEAWWREAIQNSVDNGATEVHLTVDEDDDGIRVSCVDNGSGMDVDTLMHGFLALGGSVGKGRAGKTGGFGKAKELLLLPWIRFMVHSRDTVIYGSGEDQSDPQPAAHLAGTEVTVWMDKTKATDADYAIEYIRKCYLPGVVFRVDGETVLAGMKVGTRREKIMASDGKSKVTIYYDEEAEPLWSIPVRTNGLYMFSFRKPHKLTVGRLIFEYRGAHNMLLDSRDGFADESLKYGLQDWVHNLAVNVLSALNDKQKLVKKIYRGDGLLRESEALASDLLRAAPRIQPKLKDAKKVGADEEEVADQQLPKGDVERIAEVVEERLVERRVDMARPTQPDISVAPEIVRVHLEQGLRTPEDVEHAMQTLAWMPDLYVVNEIPYFKVPTQYLPTGSGMGKIPYRVLRLWAEMCRFVMIGMGISRPFGVGWVFSSKTLGEWRQEDDPETGETRQWLLFNPLRVSKDYEKEWKDYDTPAYRHSPSVRLSDEDTLSSMFATAIHEVTHLSGCRDHDELFSSAITDMMGRMMPRWPLVKKLKNAVTVATKGKTGGKSKGGRKPAKTRHDVARDWAFHQQKTVGYSSVGHLTGTLQNEFPSLSHEDAYEIAHEAFYNAWPT
jgi:hypothetical protein